MIAGVIFDLGSTLIHFEGDWQSVFDESLHALARQLSDDGLTIDLDAFRRAFRLEIELSQRSRQQDYRERTSESVLRQTLEGMGIRDADDTLIARGLAAMFAVSEARWEPMPGLHPMLDELPRPWLPPGTDLQCQRRGECPALAESGRTGRGLRSAADFSRGGGAQARSEPLPACAYGLEAAAGGGDHGRRHTGGGHSRRTARRAAFHLVHARRGYGRQPSARGQPAAGGDGC